MITHDQIDTLKTGDKLIYQERANSRIYPGIFVRKDNIEIFKCGNLKWLICNLSFYSVVSEEEYILRKLEYEY